MNEGPIAVFAATDEEIKNIRSKMVADVVAHVGRALIFIGKFNNRQIILARTGVGRRAMNNAVEWCLSNLNPSLCLNVGYAGGLALAMNTADVIIATHVVDFKQKAVFQANEALADKAESLCKQAGLVVRRGRLLTVDKIISSPHEKAFVGTEHEALAVDMESWAFMERCEAHGTPAVSVRVILDPLDTLCPDIPDVIKKDGGVSYFTLLKHILRHPRDLASICKIWISSAKARESIASLLEAWSV